MVASGSCDSDVARVLAGAVTDSTNRLLGHAYQHVIIFFVMKRCYLGQPTNDLVIFCSDQR